MNKQFLAAFTHNNKNFEIYLEDEKIKCKCYGDEQKYINFSEEERNILISVVQSLLIDEKKSKYIKNEFINGRIYRIYYDEKTNNYFWKSEDNKNYEEDNIFLNIKYNNIPSTVFLWKRPRTYEEKLDKKLKKIYLKWIIEDLDEIKDEQKRIYMKEIYIRNGRQKSFKNIIVNSTINLLILSTIPSMLYIGHTTLSKMHDESLKPEIVVVETLPEFLEDQGEYIIEIPEETEEVQNYDWEVIKQAIEENTNITETEKEFINEIKFVFDEYHQYMDLDMVISRLKTLRITYENNSCPYNSNVGAYYKRGEENIIVNFNSSSFEDIDIRTFLHEFFHVLQKPAHGELTIELSNEAFTRETIRRLHVNGVLEKYGKNILMKTPGYYDYGDGYESWMYMYYDLAELIPQEELIKFQFQCEESILANSLSRNDNTIKNNNRAWELLNIINESENEIQGFFSSISEETKQTIKEKTKFFYELNGKSMEEDLTYTLANLSFNNPITTQQGKFILEQLDKTHYLEYEDDIEFYAGMQRKSYFSDVFPETIFFLQFAGKGINQVQGHQILLANQDAGKNYSINITEELIQQYIDYISNNQEIIR